MMTLGELKDELQKYSEEHTVRFDLPVGVQPTSFDSWRGVYAELALGYEVLKYGTAPMTVGELLRACKSANGATYEGWKGGNFRMTYRTPVHVDNRGCYRQCEIVGTRFDGYDVLLMVLTEDE